MLGVLPDSSPDDVNKSLGFAQALAKKGLKSFPVDKDINLVLYLMLILLPAGQGSIVQKGSCKQNSVLARGTSSSKVIFVLLKEIITLQVSFTPINV